jgi:hypothetical protein
VLTTASRRRIAREGEEPHVMYAIEDPYADPGFARPGWYTDPRHPENLLWWDGDGRWTDHDRTVPANSNWLLHFVLFAGAAAVLYVSCTILVGFVALMGAMRITGRRARDLLMLLIPVWGPIVVIQTLWRLTANHICWLPRTDMPSKPLFGPAILPRSLIPNDQMATGV